MFLANAPLAKAYLRLLLTLSPMVHSTMTASIHEQYHLDSMGCTKEGLCHPALITWTQGKNINICPDEICILTTINEAKQTNENNVFFALYSYNSLLDGYLHMSLNWLVEIFSGDGVDEAGKSYTSYFIIFDETLAKRHHTASSPSHSIAATAGTDSNDSNEFSSEEAVMMMIRIMPLETVFVIFNCYGVGYNFNPKNLPSLREQYGYHQHVMIHQGQEQPWSDPSVDRANHCYTIPAADTAIATAVATATTDTTTTATPATATPAYGLADIYSHYNLVFRQYYYQPFEGISEYIPLGLPNYGNALPLNRNDIPLASSRSVRCFFSGRFTYLTSGVHDIERKEIAQLIFNDAFPCKVAASYKEHQYRYHDYIELMKEVQFAPCPAGGSAETYRLYEALEVGAIPILVRQSPDRDFLHQSRNSDLLSQSPDNGDGDGLWESYPGPVLESWSKLQGYLESMSMMMAREGEGVDIGEEGDYVILADEVNQAGGEIFHNFDVDDGGIEIMEGSHKETQNSSCASTCDVVGEINASENPNNICSGKRTKGSVNHKLDALQAELIQWYAQFKMKSKKKALTSISHTFF